MNPQYEVLTLTGSEWENVWSEDDSPATFDSIDAAEAALTEHLADCRAAIRLGYMVDAPTRADFMIAPIVGGAI